MDEVARYLRSTAATTELALLYIDLDRFKPVNDTLGHSVGDEVLKEVARRIQGTVRPNDIVARLGGDEFALLQVGASQPAGSRALAKRIIDELAKPIVVDGYTVHIGVSIGAAIAPFDAQHASELLKFADLALYQAKEDGRGVLRYFEPNMNERQLARRELELELRAAIADHEFQTRYQPVMDANSKQIIGVEALVRWKHRQRGSVSPMDFIPLAEETGLIVPIGEWVLGQACQDAIAWPEHIRVAVNVSPVQLRDRDFVHTVLSALDESGLPAHRLELEITETSLMSGTELTIAILTHLREAGVKIALDDFGTGYSSINYLRRFPFDKIKIDRSFVTGSDKNSESAALVRMIAALGTSLAVATTAEGVETAEELEMVCAAGCKQIQGYLLSKPILEEELRALLSSIER
jgi:diguanylate cyclase (GGDEF)-like protein